MTIQNPIFWALILLTSLLYVNGHSNEPASGRSNGKLRQVQVAQDAINITIAEVDHAKVFVGSIPKLKSLSNVKGEPGDELVQCVGGLTDGMSHVLSKLGKVAQQLDSSSTLYSLENTVGAVVSFRDLCYHALRDVDRTITFMVQRKLDDIVLLTTDVIFRVSKLEFYGKATGKP